MLGDIIVKDSVPKEFFVDKEALKRWKAEKGGYTRTRTTKDGFTYDISFGKMDLYDRLDEPSRTIITAEGGKSVSRMKHLIQTSTGKSRRLVPLELERLNMFPDDFTKFGIDNKGEEYNLLDTKKSFLMGNAMVTGIVEQLGKKLLDLNLLMKKLKKEPFLNALTKLLANLGGAAFLPDIYKEFEDVCSKDGVDLSHYGKYKGKPNFNASVRRVLQHNAATSSQYIENYPDKFIGPFPKKEGILGIKKLIKKDVHIYAHSIYQNFLIIMVKKTFHTEVLDFHPEKKLQKSYQKNSEL